MMQRRPARLAIGLVAVGLLALGSAVPATAQQAERRLEAGAPETAEQRYDIGVALYHAGRYAEAAAEFDAALALFPTSAKLAYNLARCRERADELKPAVVAYRRYLENAPEAEDRAEVETLIVRLEERIDARRPTAKVVTTPVGATVQDADGTALGQSPLTVRLDPGVHVLRVTLHGHADAIRELTLAEGETRAVTVELEATAAPAPASIVEAAPPEPDRPVNWLAWSAVGAGMLAAGAGAFFHAQTFDTVDEADGLPPTEDGRSRYADLEDELQGEQIGAGVGYGLGAALVGTGIALLLTDDGS